LTNWKSCVVTVNHWLYPADPIHPDRNCCACTLSPSVTWTRMDSPESCRSATRIGKI
jgi:hypothetical protein